MCKGGFISTIKKGVETERRESERKSQDRRYMENPGKKENKGRDDK